jgi:hypothetical protein
MINSESIINMTKSIHCQMLKSGVDFQRKVTICRDVQQNKRFANESSKSASQSGEAYMSNAIPAPSAGVLLLRKPVCSYARIASGSVISDKSAQASEACRAYPFQSGL